MFEWQFKATAEALISVKFLNYGLREMTKEDDCNKGFIFSMNTQSSDDRVQTRFYCTNGSVTHLELPSQATVSVRVNQKQDQDLSFFTMTPESVQSKCHIHVIFESVQYLCLYLIYCKNTRAVNVSKVDHCQVP